MFWKRSVWNSSFVTDQLECWGLILVTSQVLPGLRCLCSIRASEWWWEAFLALGDYYSQVHFPRYEIPFHSYWNNKFSHIFCDLIFRQGPSQSRFRHQLFLRRGAEIITVLAFKILFSHKRYLCVDLFVGLPTLSVAEDVKPYQVNGINPTYPESRYTSDYFISKSISLFSAFTLTIIKGT